MRGGGGGGGGGGGLSSLWLREELKFEGGPKTPLHTMDRAFSH